MASQSLYRKWRSQTFSDLVGQESIVRTLCHAVRDGRLAHAYLFCGPRGTGKTSVARLLAKAVNCANPHDGEPCNECVSCREITEGRSPDVFEIDAASNNGVDNIRDLRENANILSSGGRYKVYVIDECHMLSTPAFNALLKLLEEPPPHILFVLATTEAHKVLPTIVSRCQQFNFSRHSRRNIVEHLLRVAAGEQLQLERAAADVLARAAQGGMRDALSLLDQAMAFSGSEITLDSVRGMLGLAGPGAVRELVEDVAGERSAEGLHLINDLVTAGVDLRQLNSQLAEFWRALFLARAGADVAVVMDCDPDEAAEFATLAAGFSLDELTACARVFAANETPARGLPVPQLGLELSFLECLSIRRAATGGQPAAPTAQAASHLPSPPARPAVPPSTAAPPRAAAPNPAPAGATPPPPAQRAVPAPATASAAQPEIEELDLAALDAEIDAALPPIPSSPRAAQAPMTAQQPPTTQDSAEAEDVAPDAASDTPDSGAGRTTVDDDGDWLQRVQAQWELVKKVCRQKKRTVAALLHSARPIMVAPGNPLEIVLQADYEFHLNKLREPDSRADVEWALKQVLEVPCHVRFVLAGGGEGGNGSSGALRKPPTPAPARGPQEPPSDASHSTRAANGGAGGSSGDASGAGNGPAAHTPPRAAANGSANGFAPVRTFADAAPTAFAAPPAARGNGIHPLPSDVHATASGNGLRDSGSAPVYAYTIADSARPRAPISAPFEPPAPDVDAEMLREFEEEARADPLVSEIMRSFPADLVEVRPLDHQRGR